MQKLDMKIALFGAAGAIGTCVANALRARQIPYRVVGRDHKRLASTFGIDRLAEVVAWNADDAASVRAAAQGVDTLIYLIGVPYDHFELHPIIVKQTLDGAIAAGVKRFVLIGTVYPYGMPTTPRVAETHPRNPTTFKGKMRKEQEDILLRAHADGKIQGSILRLPDFYGPEAGEASLLHLLFKAAATGGTADLIGPIDTPHEFVFVADAGPLVLDLAAKPEAYGRWWNFGLRVLGLFKPVMRELVEMHYLQTSPVLLDDGALVRLLGTVHRTPYSEGLRITFEAAKAASGRPPSSK
jgi:nucleoside-diphosphate-sugar epimerase